MKGFLYGQTEYNLLNNTVRLKDYVQAAKSCGFTFLSITDQSLYGAYKFYQLCLANNLKPIIGLEITYLADDGKHSKILAYAKNNIGFKNLLKISTYLNTNPIPTGLDFLNTWSDKIALIVVFDDSFFERLSLLGRSELAIEELKKLDSQYEIYLGYSYTNRFDKFKENVDFRVLCEQMKIKTLPLHNCRYLTSDDIKAYETLTLIAGKPIKITEFMDYGFLAEPPSDENLKNFLTQVNLDIYKKEVLLPKYHLTKGQTAKDFLSDLCQRGLFRRLRGKVLPNYRKRLEYELETIDKMGYNDYFLIVWDFILYAKKHDILVGPGRGTAAGSLVAYCLGITEIDPLKYDLWFERFLNPERVSMPDIDTDFPDTKRDEVIAYVKNVYGSDHVCNISAYSCFTLKSAIRDIGRLNKLENYRQDELIKLAETTTDYAKLLEEFKDREDIYNYLSVAKKIDGLPRHISTHAAGIIISGTKLTDIIPLQEGISGLYQSQFEACDLESIGLLKMDFLGIRNLTIISEIIKAIPEFSVEKLRNISLNDEKTYRLLAEADTLGIFQLESLGIRKVLRKLKPQKFDDLVAVLALYRPGPMENIDEFIARRHGKPFKYYHPILEPILKSTYGIIVFQEQIMLIAQVFAGFTMGEADILRRAVSKKNEVELLKLKESFITRSQQQGFSLDVATNIYEYILKFANYGFNKSHTVAYGMVSYQMAYLKANYFAVFMAKIMNNVINSGQTLFEYLNYAKSKGIITHKPNVNISTEKFEVTKVGIFMPLQCVHNIGMATTLDIVAERQRNGIFKDFEDFKMRSKLAQSSLQALVYAGALDCFGLTKKQMIEKSDELQVIFDRHLEGKIVDVSEFDFEYLRSKEEQFLGFNLTYDLFRNIKKLQMKYKCGNLSKNDYKAIVAFEQLKEINTKKNQKMLVGRLCDQNTKMEFVMFPAQYQKLNVLPKNNVLYLIDYQIKSDQRSNEEKVILNSVEEVQV